MAYKGASDMAQARLRRPVGYLLPSGFEDLTPTQQRDNIVGILQVLEEEILAEKDKWRKKDLGKRKFELTQMIHELRPKLKFDKDFSNVLLDVIKEQVTRPQWGAWVQQAMTRKEIK